SGNVTPALMNPVSQLCSVPLTEGICQTISDMNADHVMVTQQTLTEQLVKNYPGIAVPSHDILYNILGTLIKERKIYHTGEGYFIVTPNTYFITNTAIEDSRRILLEDSCCCSSPSITYLVNIKPCADLVKENIPTVSCYRSCHCFPAQNMLCEQRQVMSHESNGGGKRGCSELKPSIRTQGISTSAENRSRDTIKSLTSLKAKLKSKMFGLGLFWKSGSKKEKHKKEYSTFSAQFPPQEWPVRDEDDLDNIPRDIEHEIIKRINPTLTVDNLIKHTILMQKLEEQKKCTRKQKKHISNSTSAKVSTVRQNHLSKDCAEKAPGKTAKRTSKTKSEKEKQISRSSRKSHIQKLTSQNVKLEENFSLPMKNQEAPDAAVESLGIYKKQIKNPFQGLPWRPRSFHARGHQGMVNRQLKCQAPKQGRAFQRPRSLASSGPFGCETERLDAESEADKAKQSSLLHLNRSGLQLKKGSLSENGSYPQGDDLQIDNRSKYLLESNIFEGNVYKRKIKKKSPCSYIEDKDMCKDDVKFPFCLKDEHCRCKGDTVCELLDQTASEFQNVHLSNYSASVHLAHQNGVKYRPKADKKSELLFNYACASHPRSTELGSERFTENFHLLYREGHDGDTCNLPHLDENSEQLSPGRASSDTPDWSTAVSIKACEVSTCPDKTVNKHDSGEHRYKGSASLDGSKEHPNPGCTEENCSCRQAVLKGHREDGESGLTESGKGSAVADPCRAAEAGADAGAVQNSARQAGEGTARCALGSRIKEGRDPPGKKECLLKHTCAVIPEQTHSEGTESHSITGDSGIDSPR
ncbi:STOX1 protein, partial [Erithacus rubecula]|nr:STOX1 protein [Erithacus rubecula]